MPFVIQDSKAIIARVSKEGDRLVINIPKAAKFIKHGQQVIIKQFNYQEKRMNR